MLQLEPREYFVITRQLNDPVDEDTYYLRAYIRNAKTDEILDTVDLDDKGDQRFRKSWQVPPDTSGQGFYITILVKVFTDSGYTSESNLYGRTEQIYLIQQRYNVSAFGWGSDIDYKKVRKIIQEELQKLPSPIKPKDISWEPILEAIMANSEKIDGIKILPQKEIDLGPIARIVERGNMDIAEVKKAVSEIDISKVDFSSVLELLTQLKNKQDVSEKDLKEYINKVKDVFQQAIKTVTENILKIEKKIKVAPVVTLLSKETEEKIRRKSFL